MDAFVLIMLMSFLCFRIEKKQTGLGIDAEDVSVRADLFRRLPMLLGLAVNIRKLSILNHCEKNHPVMVRQQRSEVQMRQLIIGIPVIRIHYLTGFINSVIDHSLMCVKYSNIMTTCIYRFGRCQQIIQAKEKHGTFTTEEVW